MARVLYLLVLPNVGCFVGSNEDIVLGINDSITLGFGNEFCRKTWLGTWLGRLGTTLGKVSKALTMVLHLGIAKAPTMVLRRIKTWHIVWCARVAVYHIVQTKHAYLTVIST